MRRSAGLVVVVAFALAAAGSGAGTHVAGVGPLPVDACGPVEYGGPGQPDVLIASDLPMQGSARERSAQMVDAIRLVLADAGWRAGGRGVAFQACDDSLTRTGTWDAERCAANARGYAADPDVVGVIGTYNSGCAKIIIPILGRAAGGGVGIVSPGNTLTCLTQRASACLPTEPARYYPGGHRNYIRVVPNDARQGAGLALFARRHGLRRPYVLYAAHDPTSTGQAASFRNAARRLGLHMRGMRSWDPGATGYAALMRTARRAHPDAVVLAGLTEQHGALLIKAKVAALGANSGRVRLLAFDGFAQQSTIDEAGAAAAGMYVSLPGRAPGALTGRGRALVRRLAARHPTVELFAPYAGQAAAVLLDAVATARGARAGVIRGLFATDVRDGIVGSFRIGPTGDPTVSPITVSRAGATFRPVAEVTPPASLARP